MNGNERGAVASLGIGLAQFVISTLIVHIAGNAVLVGKNIAHAPRKIGSEIRLSPSVSNCTGIPKTVIRVILSMPSINIHTITGKVRVFMPKRVHDAHTGAAGNAQIAAEEADAGDGALVGGELGHGRRGPVGDEQHDRAVPALEHAARERVVRKLGGRERGVVPLEASGVHRPPGDEGARVEPRVAGEDRSLAGGGDGAGEGDRVARGDDGAAEDDGGGDARPRRADFCAELRLPEASVRKIGALSA